MGRVASMSGKLPSRASENTAMTAARACLRRRLARRNSSASDTGLPAAASCPRDRWGDGRPRPARRRGSSSHIGARPQQRIDPAPCGTACMAAARCSALAMPVLLPPGRMIEPGAIKAHQEHAHAQVADRDSLERHDGPWRCAWQAQAALRSRGSSAAVQPCRPARWPPSHSPHARTQQLARVNEHHQALVELGHLRDQAALLVAQLGRRLDVAVPDAQHLGHRIDDEAGAQARPACRP
jgi:hypothetical protein